jgi:protein phosphatase 2C family protein 2/3
MGANLSIPVTSKAITRTGTHHVKIAACEMQGYRGAMEDFKSIILDFTPTTIPATSDVTPPICAPLLTSASVDPTAITTVTPHLLPPPVFVGVFDGHCSDNAAAWFSEHFPQELLKQPSLDPVHIKNACMQADSKYRGYVKTTTPTVAPGGTTAVFVIIEEMCNPSNASKPYKLTIGNIGDSRCLILRGEEVEQITKDHKPTDPNEKKRITAAGGCVENGRVDGLLAVSRAFGDPFLKANSKVSAEEQKVSAVPDIFVVEGIGGDDKVLLICDGIYERSSNQQAVGILRRFLAKTPDDPGFALSKLFGAQVLRSGDNMTSVLVEFKDGSEYSKMNSQGEVEYIPMELECRQMYKVPDEDYEKLEMAFQGFGARYGYPTGYIEDPEKDSQGTRFERNDVFNCNAPRAKQLP